MPAVATRHTAASSAAPTTRRGLVLPPVGLRERRAQMDESRRGRAERRATPLGRARAEIRANPSSAAGPSFRFEGYAAIVEQPFDMWDMWGEQYQEVLSAGSFTRTLNSRPDVPFLIGHNDSGIALARTKSGTMTLAQDSTGLHVLAPSLDGRSPLVQALASAMDRGDMDEMSFAFMVNQQEWSPDFMTRRIGEVDIHRGDVSVVCLAANPGTAGAAMTAVPVSEAASRVAGLREARTPTEPYSAKPGETAQCPQCHSMNDTAAAYCDQCGTAIMSSTVASSAAEGQTQRCPCGTWNAPDAKFCRDCGENIASDNDADNGGWGNGINTVERGDYWAARRPMERRGEPDFTGAPPQDVSAHGEGSLTCPNEDCGLPNSQDARYCDQCGQPLYDEGGLIESGGSTDDVVSDSSGLVEEEDMTLAAARLAIVKLKAGVR
jgi:HK97 family phage prohead protease